MPQFSKINTFFRSPGECFEAYLTAKRQGDDRQMLGCYSPAKATREIGVVIMEIAANVFMETDLKAKTLKLLASHGISESWLREVIENGPAHHGDVFGALDAMGEKIASPVRFMSDVRGCFPRPPAPVSEWKSVEIDGDRALAQVQENDQITSLPFVKTGDSWLIDVRFS